eukprot:8089543-Pyramimonas_sp.AAC.1
MLKYTFLPRSLFVGPYKGVISIEGSVPSGDNRVDILKRSKGIIRRSTPRVNLTVTSWRS